MRKVDLTSLKWEINKLDTGKLETLPVDLEKINDVFYKEVLKKMCMMNWLKMWTLWRPLILVT